jgi:hypothetical protein
MLEINRILLSLSIFLLARMVSNQENTIRGIALFFSRKIVKRPGAP